MGTRGHVYRTSGQRGRQVGLLGIGSLSLESRVRDVQLKDYGGFGV